MSRLARLLDDRGGRLDYAAVEAQVRPRESEVPVINIPSTTLEDYDALIGGAA